MGSRRSIPLQKRLPPAQHGVRGCLEALRRTGQHHPHHAPHDQHPLSDNARTKMAPISPRKIRILESAVHHTVNQA